MYVGYKGSTDNNKYICLYIKQCEGVPLCKTTDMVPHSVTADTTFMSHSIITKVE